MCFFVSDSSEEEEEGNTKIRAGQQDSNLPPNHSNNNQRLIPPFSPIAKCSAAGLGILALCGRVVGIGHSRGFVPVMPSSHRKRDSVHYRNEQPQSIQGDNDLAGPSLVEAEVSSE